MALVTLTDEEWSAHKAKLTKTEADLAEARQDQRALARDSVPDDVRAAFRAAVPIVQFAVSNLDPATVRGWPVASLRAVADGLEIIGDVYDVELAKELHTFANEAAEYERFRVERDGPGPRPPGPPASPSDFGPKTAEAEIVHEGPLGQRAGRA